MTGLQPLTNCKCLALVDCSATRKTTKLAGTKDMATMMKMAMTTSVPCNLGEIALSPAQCHSGTYQPDLPTLPIPASHRDPKPNLSSLPATPLPTSQPHPFWALNHTSIRSPTYR